MNKKTTGIVAGAAGAALLVGGATFALWSDSAPVAGGTITAGNLDVEAVAPEWKDVSADRTGGPHAIDLETFRIVPGDTIQGTFGFKAALEGDNMVAELSLDQVAAQGELLAELAEHATFQVVSGGTVIDSGDLDEAEGLLFASADNSQNVAALPTLPATLGTDPNVSLVVELTFDEDVAEQDLVGATALLEDFHVTLTQVRDAGVGGGF